MIQVSLLLSCLYCRHEHILQPEWLVIFEYVSLALILIAAIAMAILFIVHTIKEDFMSKK